MTFWIPKKKEIWQREKPAELIELNQAHSIGAEIDILIPLDGSLEVYGRKRVSKSELLSSGSDTTYLQWADDGIENSVYDGTYADGMGLKTALPAEWNVTERIVGFQVRTVSGSAYPAGKIHFGLGDRWSADTSLDGGYNSFVVNDGDIDSEVGNQVRTYTGAFIRDGNPHTYVEHITTVGGVKTGTLFVDGKLFGTVTHSNNVHDYSALIALGCASNNHNSGLQGVMTTAFYIGHRVPIDLAQQLSEAPHQIVVAGKTYYMLGAAGGAGAALAGDAAGQATGTGALTTDISLAGASLSVATANGAITTSIPLDGLAAAVSLATGALSAQIKLDGAAIGQALANAWLTTDILLAAAAAAQAAATGDLTAGGGAAELAGDAAGVATADGDLDTGIDLSGDAAGQADAAGDLSTSVDMAGGATGVALATGDLTIQITLAGDAVSQALATGALTAPGSGLEGGATAQASSGGAISTDIPLLGNSSAVVTAQGGIDTILQLQGAAASASNMAGGLTTQVTLNAQAFIQALAQAGLTAPGSGLEGDAGAVADANAVLKIGVSFDGDALSEALARGALSGQLLVGLTLTANRPADVFSANIVTQLAANL